MLINTDIRDQLLHITECDLVDVGEDTVFPISIVLVFPIGLNVIDNLMLEDIRVSQKVNYLILINWHSLWIGEVHCLLLEDIAILQGEVLFFTDLGHFSLDGVRAGYINKLV